MYHSRYAQAIPVTDSRLLHAIQMSPSPVRDLHHAIPVTETRAYDVPITTMEHHQVNTPVTTMHRSVERIPVKETKTREVSVPKEVKEQVIVNVPKTEKVK